MREPTPSPRPHLTSFTTYHPGKPVHEVQRELGLSDVIKLASNENALGASPAAKRAILESLDEISTYPDTACVSLRSELGEQAGVPLEHVVVGNGAVELIYSLCQAYLQPGDEVITGQPSFSAYYIAARIQDANVVKVPLAGHRFDLEGLLAALTPRTRLIFIANPNNPTGTIRGTPEIRAFLERVPPQVLVILDEAYHEFVRDPSYAGSLDLLERFPNVIVLRSLSKTIGIAGLRVGYGIARPAIVQSLTQVQVPFHVNLLAQRAAIAALRDREFLSRTLAMLAEGRAYLYGELARLPVDHVRTEANFVYVGVRSSARELFDRMLRQGVIVRPCDGFDAPEHIRVTIGLPDQNARFIRALERALPASR